MLKSPARRPLIVTVIAVVMLLGPFVSIATATQYAYTCDGTANLSHMKISKDVTQTAYWIKGVAGDAAVRQLAPCNAIGHVFGAQWDFPAVLLANLQDYNSKTSNIVQIGYARCGLTGFLESCNGMTGDNNMYMAYTDSDHNGGAAAPANWFHGGSKLIVGHRYRGRVTRITSGCGIGQADCWQICARDITAGESYTCTTIDLTWATVAGGNFAWWGSETNNHASQMGVAGSDTDFNMDYMQYLTTQAGAAWTVRTGMTSCETYTGAPTYYHCNIGTTVYTKDTLYSWTELH